MTRRLSQKFKTLRASGQKAFIPFITAGDPDFATCLDLLLGLPRFGADIIELGIPFTDPMADGLVIQASSQRALKNGQNLKKTLILVHHFREHHPETPIVLMGYYNPIYVYGREKFLQDAKACGVDGLIIVDLPPEEDEELCLPALRLGVDFIRLIAPTTDDNRIKMILKNMSGFVYYISITGITGSTSPDNHVVSEAITRIRQQTSLPVAVGFGINTPQQAQTIASKADAVVIGSILVKTIQKSLDTQGKATSKTIKNTLELARIYAQNIKHVSVS